jgi:hypothetical protein
MKLSDSVFELCLLASKLPSTFFTVPQPNKKVVPNKRIAIFFILIIFSVHIFKKYLKQYYYNPGFHQQLG